MTTPPPQDDLAVTVPKPVSDRVDEARQLWAGLLGSSAPLGRLGQAAASLCAMQDSCPPRSLERVRILAQGFGSRPTPDDTERALIAAADSAQVPIRWITCDDDLSAREAMGRGAAAVDAEVDSGVDLLILADPGEPSTEAAAIIGLLANRDAATVTPRPVDLNDAAWMAQCTGVREGMRRARDHRADPIGVLDALGATAVAVLAGALLQAAVRRTPLIIDGTSSVAAALLIHRLAHRSTRWWWAASASTDPGLTAALDRLDAEPLLVEEIPPSHGVAAVLATQALRTVVSVMSSSARTGA